MTNNLAPLRLRFIAGLTDALIHLFLFTAFLFIAASQSDLAHFMMIFFIYLAIVTLNPLYYYQTIILTHFFGGSLGKLLTGLRVTSESGTRLSFKRVFFRQTIGYLFAGLVLGLGFFSISKDVHKQGWHDKAIGSLVVIHQPIWYVGVLVSAAYLVLSCYFGAFSYQKITTGPLSFPLMRIAKNLSAITQQNTGKQPAKTYIKINYKPVTHTYPQIKTY